MSVQEFFDFCRKGNLEKSSQWIQHKAKKPKLSFLRPNTPNNGWLSNLRDPSTAYTALHWAALNGHYEIVQLLVLQDQQLVTAKDKRGCLPLHLAAWNGHHQIVQFLLESEISTIDEVNNAKETALHLAAQHGNGKVVAILLQKQASARLRNARFETALDIAARTGKENVCRLLICHCPELLLQTAAECSRSENKTISKHIVYPLHVAAKHGHIECLRVFCESGFDVNYVTEEGTALHVAALYGQVEAVKLLLRNGIDIYVKDCQGKTVLEKLEEHETQRTSDLTQIMQNRERWAECRKLIEEYANENDRYHNSSSKNQEKESVWRTLPENSLAVNHQLTSKRISTASSNGGIYYPPSMTVEHVIMDDDDHNRASAVSTITLSTQHCDPNLSFNDSVGHETYSNSSSVSPSIASTSSQVRAMPKFPVTSPNAKARHVNTNRFGKPFLINGIEAKMPSNSTLNSESSCSYQPPPSYETWQQKQAHKLFQDNMNNSPLNSPSYRNIPQPYDNAPFAGHRKWDHACQNKGLPNEHQTFQSGTVGFSNGKNLAKSNHVVRNDGTQTIPAVKLTSYRPTILNGVFDERIKEQPEKPVHPPSLPPKPRLKDSKSTEFDKKSSKQTPVVTFASSTLERSVPVDQVKHNGGMNGKAPLALPEEIGGSTCTSIVSMSPERVLHPIDERLRRSMTVNSEDRTLVSMHEDFSAHRSEEKLDALTEKSTPSTNSAVVSSPQSIDTVESSCSLPQVSQLSSSSVSSIRPCSTEMPDKSDSSNVVISLRGKSKNRQPSQASTIAEIEIDQVEEWKKIEDILNAIRRDSLFAEPTNSPVAVTVRNRKSQALTLQMSSVNANGSPPRNSNISYPSEAEDLSNLTDALSEKLALSPVAEWLGNQVGLPLARSAEVGAILEKNGFDQVNFLKGSLTKEIMAEMGIDKSIQHQISVHLENQVCKIPSINKFEYASDWLSSLKLIDYLGLFAVEDLTSTKKIEAANLTPMDIRLMGITLPGHLERIHKSIKLACRPTSSLSAVPTAKAPSTSSIATTEQGTDPSEEELLKARASTLMYTCVPYSAHYLGSSEISNVEGAEDCRRAMNTMKSRIRQINKVPQVLLEISINGVTVLDSTTNRIMVRHEINRIQVVCQDELDLNCFAYLFQDGERNFCHVYCVLTADMAKDIIKTLGCAFNLAYKLALGNTGQ
uniref:Ankyrin repeat and sterile alpha motif domain-containing protein 1B n=1 Tax=Panagrolaimus sp. JU765 TaxID=591449 RepID=A0AC34Q500_9BILA